MNKKTIIFVVIVALLAVGAFVMGQRRAAMMHGGSGSAGGELPSAADAEKFAGDSAAQKVGDINVALTINPYPPTMRQPTEFSVTLTDASGKAINDAKVTLDLTMPEMYMPPNKPALNFIADGKYSAMGQFTMRGWWRIEVIIARGGQTQSVFFDLGL
jgi:hypothetical protein